MTPRGVDIGRLDDWLSGITTKLHPDPSKPSRLRVVQCYAWYVPGKSSLNDRIGKAVMGLARDLEEDVPIGLCELCAAVRGAERFIIKKPINKKYCGLHDQAEYQRHMRGKNDGYNEQRRKSRRNQQERMLYLEQDTGR